MTSVDPLVSVVHEGPGLSVTLILLPPSWLELAERVLLAAFRQPFVLCA